VSLFEAEINKDNNACQRMPKGMKAMSDSNIYSCEPADKEAFTQRLDRGYALLARPYDIGVKLLPVWKTWLKRAIPHIQGPRVLEVSFGTGFLLTQYAGEFDTDGIDFNEKMVAVASRNLKRKKLAARLAQGNVEELPYEQDTFDCIVNTMAFSGYPDGHRAMSELHRVLKPGGRLVIIDVEYPADRNRLGMRIARLWVAVGDLIRNLGKLLHEFDFDYSEEEIGGFGTIHLYVATKVAPKQSP